MGASPLHGACGLWGLIVVGLFAKEDYLVQQYPKVMTPKVR